MNSPIKISLTIYLEGSVLVRQDNPELIRTEDGKFVKHFNKVAKPATQVLKMTEEAYEEFISDEAPAWAKKKYPWPKMSKGQRVKAHCKRICESLHGTGFEYTILKD